MNDAEVTKCWGTLWNYYNDKSDPQSVAAREAIVALVLHRASLQGKSDPFILEEAIKYFGIGIESWRLHVRDLISLPRARR